MRWSRGANGIRGVRPKRAQPKGRSRARITLRSFCGIFFAIAFRNLIAGPDSLSAAPLHQTIERSKVGPTSTRGKVVSRL
jgi:hypothetical protein